MYTFGWSEVYSHWVDDHRDGSPDYYYTGLMDRYPGSPAVANYSTDEWGGQYIRIRSYYFYRLISQTLKGTQEVQADGGDDTLEFGTWIVAADSVMAPVPT